MQMKELAISAIGATGNHILFRNICFNSTALKLKFQRAQMNERFMCGIFLRGQTVLSLVYLAVFTELLKRNACLKDNNNFSAAKPLGK